VNKPNWLSQQREIKIKSKVWVRTDAPYYLKIAELIGDLLQMLNKRKKDRLKVLILSNFEEF
jgi:hypothetical protein